MFLKNIKKSNLAGVSLIELMVSVTIFVIILMSMTSIFKMVIDSQRAAIATQNVQESLKYFFEVISKEIRMAQRTGSGCSQLANRRFAIGSNAYGDVLYLRNYHNECVTYDLALDENDVKRFRVERGAFKDYLSPANVNISNLKFIVTEEANEQAYVSINLSAHSVGREKEISTLHVQTTITSRYYRPMNP
jgi:type II secretory pathway component PulJ